MIYMLMGVVDENHRFGVYFLIYLVSKLVLFFRKHSIYNHLLDGQMTPNPKVFNPHIPTTPGP